MANTFYPRQTDYIEKLNEMVDAQIVPAQADWTATSGVGFIKNKPTLAAVATSGSKADVGLPNVDNTSDASKPVSVAQANALASKADAAATTAALASKASLNGDATQNFKVASLNGGALGGTRNRIINGGFLVNQRNFTSAASDYAYVADMWRSGNSAALNGFANYGANYNGPTSANGNRGAYVQTATVKSSLASGDYVNYLHNIEGFNVADLMFGTANAKTVTISFRAFASQATTIAVTLRNAAANRAYVAPVAVSVGTNTYSVSIPGDTAGVWENTTNIGIGVMFVYACGTSLHNPTPNAWSAGLAFGHSSVSNILDTASRTVTIADIQLEKGSVATPFAHRTYSEELAMCQRYFEVGDAPSLYTNSSAVVTAAYGDMPFKVAKRAAPAVFFTGWKYYSYGADTLFTPLLHSSTINRFVYIGKSLTNWDGWAPGGTWSASSDL